MMCDPVGDVWGDHARLPTANRTSRANREGFFNTLGRYRDQSRMPEPSPNTLLLLGGIPVLASQPLRRRGARTGTNPSNK